MPKKISILENIKKDVNKSKNILQDKGLFLYQKNLTYVQNGYSLEDKPSMNFQKHSSYYSTNQDSFLFKLIDGSIIQAGFVFDKRNRKIIHYRMVYISSPFDDDQMNAFSEVIPESEKENIFCDDQDKTKTNIISFYFDKIFDRFQLEEEKIQLIESFIALSRNPIIIRFDYDEDCSAKNHPLAHITINNYPHSRFKIYDMIDISRFVIFVLDIVYGIKFDSGNRNLSVNIEDSFLNIGFRA